MIEKRFLIVTAVLMIAASIACGGSGGQNPPSVSEITRPAAGEGTSGQSKPTREAPTARPAPTDRPTRTPQPSDTPAPEATATEEAEDDRDSDEGEDDDDIVVDGERIVTGPTDTDAET